MFKVLLENNEGSQYQRIFTIARKVPMYQNPFYTLYVVQSTRFRMARAGAPRQVLRNGSVNKSRCSGVTTKN
jgi:hypothetical protein